MFIASHPAVPVPFFLVPTVSSCRQYRPIIMDIFLSLPDELLALLLLEWLDLPTVVRLDSAYASYTSRAKFLHRISDSRSVFVHVGGTIVSNNTTEKQLELI